MFKKGSKKALSQVDWAMSLGIFLLYLAWFFIVVKPLLTPSDNLNVLLDVLDSGVRENFFQDISRIRIFVPGSAGTDVEPIIIPFSEPWKESLIANSADYFVVDDGRMFFLANLSAARTFTLYHPLDALEFTAPRVIHADEERVSSGDFSAGFAGYLLDTVRFMDEERVMGFNMEVDDTALEERGSFRNMSFMAAYRNTGDYLNISQYVFADSSRVYFYITPGDRRNHSVVLEFVTFNYTSFYFDRLGMGDVSYGIAPNCRYYHSDFLDLYGDGTGLLLAAGENTTIRMCSNETNVRLRLEFDANAGETQSFMLMFHEGDVDDVLEYPVEPVVGVTESLDVVSQGQVSLLRNRNYNYLKQVFGYPKQRDFNITVESDVIDASFGISPPEFKDVYARRIEGVMIDNSYNPNRVVITLNVW
jgi:hypothetical protein